MKRIKGLQPHRFKDNPEEKRFADAWASTCRLGSTLAYLLHTGDQIGRPPEPSDRDHVVAATVVQWLGSPVGQAWLRDLGYERSVLSNGEGEKP
jgi:hypothetical protein